MEQRKEKAAIKPTRDPYDDDEIAQMVEQDEMEPEEAGFMEGYNQKQGEQNKKPRDIVEMPTRKEDRKIR